MDDTTSAANDVTAGDWLAFGIAVLLGFVIGSLLAAIVRRYIDRDDRPEGLRSASGAIAQFAFWMSVVAGLLIGVSFVNPDAVSDIPDALITYLPRVIVAAVFLIVGQVVGSMAAAAVGQGLQRTSGQRQPAIESAVKNVIFALFGILALAQLGIDNTIIYILVAALVGAVALSASLIAGLGGQDVARQIAAGRALKSHLAPGTRVSTETIEGTVTRVSATMVELLLDDGATMKIPYTEIFGQRVRTEAPDLASPME